MQVAGHNIEIKKIKKGSFYLNKHGLKHLYDDIISAVDDFFNQWDPSTATAMKEVCGLQSGLYWKINHIWSHSMRVSWLAYELFRQPLHSGLNYINHAPI